MFTSITDSQQREDAIDPSRSFIVQAPAGSGKTELLTQRFLRLLATVNAPEEIVALTFTRKAASEMRGRIILALERAMSQDTPLSAHQEKTHTLAVDVLARSELLGWQLIKQPNRLRVMTIDALCQTINQAMPLQSQQIPYATISDKADALYQMAALACFEHALRDESCHEPLKTLLEHLDNRQDLLLDLLSDLLAKRDQWLSSLYQMKDQRQATMDHMLSLIEHQALMRLKDAVPVLLQERLCTLSRQMAEIDVLSSPRSVLRDWFDFDALDRTKASGLAALLLTSNDELRKKLDHHVGLKRGVCDDALYDKLKLESTELFLALNEQPDFLDALLKVKNLPPSRYDPEQWQTLQALCSLLPWLVAHLHLEFTKHNEIDFTAVSQQAIVGLGDDEAPTDLALYLDNRINHLLIDEFQDTSTLQFQLMTKLVAGWEPGDGRTVFVVGDPMQSIYRFRQAEVGLFLKAKQQGLGSVSLDFLELSSNFRSTAAMVAWVNQHFFSIFPKEDLADLGGISFHPSHHVVPASIDSYVEAYELPSRVDEANAIATCVANHLHHFPEEDVAILVRSRTQLMEITRTLRARQIPFQGIEIDLLSTLLHLRDVWSLTQALLLPGNRLAWLSLLRSPFCGLSRVELHEIANFNTKQSIYYALSHLEDLSLTEASRIRLQWVYNVLHNALIRRHHAPLVEWLVETFRVLHGDKLLNTDEQADLEQFWLLIERFSNQGQYPNLEELSQEFNLLYSKRTNPSRLKVMTIHKSKGLEFDCVILPGLSAKGQTRDNALLRWITCSTGDEEIVLAAPMKAAHHQRCLLYDYLSEIDSEKSQFELQRLFYVAVTRAKKRLYLFDYKGKKISGTFRHLLKNQTFSTYPDHQVEAEQTTDKDAMLYRLPTAYYLNPSDCIAVSSPVLFPGPNNARQVGVVAHALLQWICDHHPQQEQALPWDMVVKRFKQLGFDDDELRDACALLKRQITALFHDPIGLWLIAAHNEAANEYALLARCQNEVKPYIVDRTFVDDNNRWIIDFKTGHDDCDAEKAHRKQVNHYASLFVSDSEYPIRCGLYYLATGRWVEWSFSEN